MTDKQVMTEPIAITIVQQIATESHQTADNMIKVVNRKHPPACHIGCHFCCYSPVTVTPPEAMTIARRLKETLNGKQLKKFQRKIREKVQQIKGKTWAEHADKKIACSLLGDDGKCSIYEFRPVMCRSWSSMNKKHCEKSFNTGWSKGEVLNNPVVKDVGNQILSGQIEALRHEGLEAGDFELNEAIYTALKHSHPELEYLAKKPVFENVKFLQNADLYSANSEDGIDSEHD